MKLAYLVLFLLTAGILVSANLELPKTFIGPALSYEDSYTLTDGALIIERTARIKNFYDNSSSEYLVYNFNDTFPNIDSRNIRELSVTIDGESVTYEVRDDMVFAKFKEPFKSGDIKTVHLHFKIMYDDFHSKQFLDLFGIKMHCNLPFNIDCYPFDSYELEVSQFPSGNVSVLESPGFINGSAFYSTANLPLAQCHTFIADSGFAVKTDTKQILKVCTKSDFSIWNGSSVSIEFLFKPPELILLGSEGGGSNISFCTQEQCILAKDDKTSIYFISVWFYRTTYPQVLFTITLIFLLLGCVSIFKNSSDLNRHFLFIGPAIISYLMTWTAPRPKFFNSLTDWMFALMLILCIAIWLYNYVSKKPKKGKIKIKENKLV